MNPPDPDAVAWLEDPDRLAHQRAAEPAGPHVCDEQCTTTPAGLAAEPTLTRQAPDPAEYAELESALTVARDGIRILAAPTLNGVAALDELLKAAAVKPARRRRWWWLW